MFDDDREAVAALAATWRLTDPALAAPPTFAELTDVDCGLVVSRPDLGYAWC